MDKLSSGKNKMDYRYYRGQFSLEQGYQFNLRGLIFNQIIANVNQPVQDIRGSKPRITLKLYTRLHTDVISYNAIE